MKKLNRNIAYDLFNHSTYFRLLTVVLVASLTAWRCSSSDQEPTTSPPPPPLVVRAADSIVLYSPGESFVDSDDYALISTADGEEYLVILNSTTFNVAVFNLKEGTQEKEFKLAAEGPNSLGALDSYTSPMFVDNQLAIFSNASSSIIYTNLNGTVQKKYAIDSRLEEEYGVRPHVTGPKPPISVDGGIILPCRMASPVSNDFAKLPALAMFTPNESGVLQPNSPMFRLPQVYNIGLTGFATWRYVPSIISKPEKNEYLVSFPLSPLVYVYDKKGIPIDSFEIASSYVKDIEPLLSLEHRQRMFDRDVGPPSNEELNRYDLTTSDYYFLWYNEPTNLYGRVATVRPSIDQYEAGDTTPDYAVLIFDEKGTILGETKLSGDIYSFYTSFVSKDGLYVLNYAKSIVKEGKLHFELLQFTPSNASMRK